MPGPPVMTRNPYDKNSSPNHPHLSANGSCVRNTELVFERDMDLVEEYTNMVAENTEATVVSVRAFHNPTPIKVRLDKALKELE